MKKRLASEHLEDLIFISPEYLRPYLEFIRENRRLFKVALSHSDVLNAEGTYRQMFTNIFSPVLDRFHFPEQEKAYIILFYIGGMIAIVKEWISKDCDDSIEQIVKTCMRCIIPDGKENE